MRGLVELQYRVSFAMSSVAAPQYGLAEKWVHLHHGVYYYHIGCHTKAVYATH